MKGELKELDRLTANFSALVREQSRQAEAGLRTLAQALSRAADRLAGARPSGPAPSAPSPRRQTPAAAVSLHLVRVMNEESQPVPVKVLGRGQRGRDSGPGGFLGGLLGGLGALVGNLFGGIFSGFATPVTGLLFGTELIVLGDRILAIVREVRAFAVELARAIRGVVEQLFKALHQAGIFPVVRLVTTILFFIDRGIALILAHLKPVFDWVTQVIGALVAWMGRFINALSGWLSRVMNTLPAFLRDLANFLIETAVRPAVSRLVRDVIRSLVDSLLSIAYGFLFSLSKVLIASGKWIGEWIGFVLRMILSALPFPFRIPAPKSFPSPLGPRIEKEAYRGYASGRELGRMMAQNLLGPAPSGKTSGTPGSAKKGAKDTPGKPKIRLPGFRIPPLELPELPTPAPRLEGLLRPPAEREKLRTLLPPGVIPAAGKECWPAGGLTLNGDIHIEIAAQSVDPDSAEETARQIAHQVLEEMRRLTERDYFRRGLPTEALD